MKIIKHIIFLAALIAAGDAVAQDSQFTQFYAAPTYLNPAFAGTGVQSRFSMNYRNQWTAIPGGWVAYNANYDQYLPQINSGLGIIATHERAGTGALRSTTIGAMYSYEVRIQRDLFFRPALQMSYSNRAIDFSQLTFGDQLLRDNAEVTLEQAALEPVNFFDFATGMLLMSQKGWFGLALHHINEPNESIYGGNYAILPRKFSAHGGYRLKLNGYRKKMKKYIVPAFNYKSQGDFDQLDMGLYYEFSPLVMGIWYRGLALKRNGYNHPNHDAVAFTFGYEAGRYKIGYSYDITVSQLTVGATAGAHEISFSYEWANKHNKKLSKRRVVPCAKF